jgi:hypothetical protein
MHFGFVQFAAFHHDAADNLAFWHPAARDRSVR